MKRIKKWALLLSTLCCILLGAALPHLTARAQDARLSRLEKKTELSAVSLTLRQEGGVGPILQLVAGEHTETLWEGKTILSKTDALQGALETLETMNQHGLFPDDSLKRLRQREGTAWAHLLIAEDGSSALVWNCVWDYDGGAYVTVDDATGMAVRIMVERGPRVSTGSTDMAHTEEAVLYQVEKWSAFLQSYYAMTPTDRRENWLDKTVQLHLSGAGADEVYAVNLELADHYTLFNYK